MDKPTEEIVITALAVGIEQVLLDSIGMGKHDIQVSHVPCNVDQLMENTTTVPSFVLCGVPPEGVSIVEVAQVVRMQYAEAPIYLIVAPGAKFDRKNLVKNGFTDVFFLPLDIPSASNAIAEEIIRIRKRGRIYRPVQVVDLQPDQVLDFDTYVYFPANDKHVCFMGAGSPMEAERVERLKKHKMNSLFVSEAEMPKFYAYTAQALKALGKDGKLSETERAEKLQHSVRDLISGLFSDTATGTDSGKKIVEDCQNIVKSYVSNEPGGGWYQRLLAATSEGGDTYSHAANVSTYAALFGIAMGLKSVDDLALAGLLHDIGLAKVALDADAKEMEKHPEYSIEMIRDRKLIVSDLVYKIILQHHEAYDGSGYPKGLQGPRICVEAQLLSLADRFAELMEVKPGQPAKDAIQALAELRATLIGQAKQPIDPELVKKVLALFPDPNAKSAA